MPRDYVPHPGPVPSREKARERWVRPGYVPGTTIGHEPYATYVERAVEGIYPFEAPVAAQPGESHADLVARVMASGKITKLAAHTVALGLAGYDHLAAGRRTVHAKELFLHRVSAQFLTDPSPVRGDLANCTTRQAFRDVYPSVGVNLSALTALRWSSDLRPQDIYMVWLLIGFAVEHLPLPSVRLWKTAFGISRPSANLRRISQATFSLRDTTLLPRDLWSDGEPIFMGKSLNPNLLEYTRPRAGGENYGYIDLIPLSLFTSRWQEHALRQLTGAGVRARMFWSGGGKVNWFLSFDECAEVFSLRSIDINRLREERLKPFSELLWGALDFNFDDPFSTRCRIKFDFKVLRADSQQGRPTAGVLLLVDVFPASDTERPKGRYAVERSADRKKRQPAATDLFGLIRPATQGEIRRKRSVASKMGWKKRRNYRKTQSNDRPPKLPSADELLMAEVLLNMCEEERRLPDAKTSISLAVSDPALSCPEAAYGQKDAEFIEDWDVLLENFYKQMPG